MLPLPQSLPIPHQADPAPKHNLSERGNVPGRSQSLCNVSWQQGGKGGKEEGRKGGREEGRKGGSEGWR